MILTLTSTNATCIGATDGTATVVATGGIGPYTYQWDDLHSQMGATAVGLMSATYTVYVKDSTGAITSGTVVVGFVNTGCTEPTPNAGYQGDTVAFSFTRNRWITRYSFQPEYYGAIRNEIVSFVDGELFLHEAHTLFNYFYGVQQSSTLTVVVNKAPLKVKYFNAIAISSNSPWSVPDLSTPANIQYPVGMSSVLAPGKFRVIEGKYYSDILRDTNTPGFNSFSGALVNGRPMTGQSMSATLQNDDSTLSVIFSIEIIYTYSEKS